MQSLVQHIKAAVLDNPRPFYILYVNPQLADLFEEADFVNIVLKTPRFVLYSNN
jgi:hypothetical protein